VFGFDGDPSRLARLREELSRVHDAFPRHLEKALPPAWFDAEDMARNQRFDAIVRAHKNNRLELPIVAIQHEGTPYHNFSLMHLRRLAWFVPSLLAAWSRADSSFPFGRLRGRELTSILASTEIVEGPDWSWTTSEVAALSSFFEAALLAALATPLVRAEPASVRKLQALQDSGRVIEALELAADLDSTSAGRALETLDLAAAMHVPDAPLADAWANEPTTLAEDHVLVALDDALPDRRPLLARASVADRLSHAFFEATGERAEKLSAAEALVRAWL
jgi:hypothetical protein